MSPPSHSPRREVCVKLSGRLGNQMFQYATGLALARRIGATLTLDGAPLDSPAKSRVQIIRSFALTEPCYHSGTSVAERLSRFLARSCGVPRPPFRKHGLPIVHETGLAYDPTVFEHNEGCHLMGRWQSARYFESVDGEIRKTFDLGRHAGAGVQAHAESIRREVLPVAVHLRRGDYATNPRTLSRFGLCTRPYYDAARRHLESVAQPSHYFVFSDDPAAAQAELAGWTNTTFLSGHTAEEDLWLIGQCRQAIISNSTFAWWGGWLIPPSPGKIIVAPKQWFAAAMQQRKSPRDIYCPDWVQV
ncbi:Glycosyl transferase family 11 [Lacunisphaera limnophila]|uniref:Glycosyl transferase family 11 n=1 Tax=Lacunisphaera limnophila TaxID=1838286 RepID=A0A1D8AR74_9BACT|nr:alpha-1,2-fucosyltransferase [Lacunisphaera limnophila]AOS43388.1 Glycosyl transferase family 11 [Lacunisphaera limnophila]